MVRPTVELGEPGSGPVPVPAATAGLTVPPHPGRALKDLRLLVVEDDPGDVAYLAACLQEIGIRPEQISWATSLRDGLAGTAAAPDCVFVDLGLPDATGTEVIAAIVERAPDAAVIVLTGRDEREVGLALAAGAQDYLVKNELTNELLGRCVSYAVDRKRAEKTSRQLSEARLIAAENRRLERGLLPNLDLGDIGVEVATHYRPPGHALLGGDFYDLIATDDARLRIVVGDVMGHGADEAAVGVQLRAAWRSLVLAGLDQARTLHTVQAVLRTETSRYMFATLCDLVIDADRRAVSVLCAGHPPPLLIGPDGADFLPVPPQPPVGVDAGAVPIGHRFALPDRWRLLVFTDGLLELFRDRDDNADLGLEGLRRAAAALDPDAGGQAWLDGLIRAAPRESRDDVAAVAICPTGPSRRAG